MRQPRQQPQMPPQIQRHGSLGAQRSLGAHVPVGERLGKRSPLGRRKLGIHSLGRGFSSAFVGGPPSSRASSGEQGGISAASVRRENSTRGNSTRGNSTQENSLGNSAVARNGVPASEGNGRRGALPADSLPTMPLGRFSRKETASGSVGDFSPAPLGHNLIRQASSRLATPLGLQASSLLPQQLDTQSNSSPQNNAAPTLFSQPLSQLAEPASLSPAPNQPTPTSTPQQPIGNRKEQPIENRKKQPIGNRKGNNNAQSSLAPSSVLPHSTNSGETLPNSAPTGSVLPNSTLPKSTQSAATGTELSSPGFSGKLPEQPLGKGLSGMVQKTLALAQKLKNQPLGSQNAPRNQGRFLPPQQSEKLAGGNPGHRADGNKRKTARETANNTTPRLQPLDTLVEKVTDAISTVSKIATGKTATQQFSAVGNTVANGTMESGPLPQGGSGNDVSMADGASSARRPLGIRSIGSRGHAIQRAPLGNVLAQPLQRKSASTNAPKSSSVPFSPSAENLPIASRTKTTPEVVQAKFLSPIQSSPQQATSTASNTQVSQAQASGAQASGAQASGEAIASPNPTVQRSAAIPQAPLASAKPNRPSSAGGDFIQRQAQVQNSKPQPTITAPSVHSSQNPIQQTQPAIAVSNQNPTIQAKAAEPAGNTDTSATSGDASSEASPSNITQPSWPTVQRQETSTPNPSQTPSGQSPATENLQRTQAPNNTAAQSSTVQAKQDSPAVNASDRIGNLVQRQADNSQQQSSFPNSQPQPTQPTVQRQTDATTPSPSSPTPQSPTPQSPTPQSPTPQSPTPQSPTPQSPTEESFQRTETPANTTQPSIVQAKDDLSAAPSDKISDLVQRQADTRQQQSPLPTDNKPQPSQPQPSQPTLQRQASDAITSPPQSLEPNSPSSEIFQGTESLANTTQPSTVQSKQDSPAAPVNASDRISNLVQRQVDTSQQQSSSPNSRPQPNQPQPNQPQPSQPTLQRQADATTPPPSPEPNTPSTARFQGTETPANTTAQPSIVQAKDDSPAAPVNAPASISNLVQRPGDRSADTNQQQSPSPTSTPQTSQPTVQRQVDSSTHSPQNPALHPPSTESPQKTRTPTTAQSPIVEAKYDSPAAPVNASDRIGNLVQRQVDTSQQQSASLSATPPPSQPQPSQPTLQRQADAKTNPPQGPIPKNHQRTKMPADEAIQSPAVEANSDSPATPNNASARIGDLVQRQVASTQPELLPPNSTTQPSQPLIQRQATPAANPQTRPPQQKNQHAETSANPVNPASRINPSVSSVPSQKVQAKSDSPSATSPSLQHPVPNHAAEPAIQSKEQSLAVPLPSTPSPNPAVVQRQADLNSDVRDSEVNAATPTAPASANTPSVQRQIEASAPNTSTTPPLKSPSQVPNQDSTRPNPVETTAADTASVESIATSNQASQPLPTTVQRQADTSEPPALTTAKPDQAQTTPAAQTLTGQPSPTVQRDSAQKDSAQKDSAQKDSAQKDSAEAGSSFLAQPHLPSQDLSPALPSHQTVQRQETTAPSQETTPSVIQAKATTSSTDSPSKSDPIQDSDQQDTPSKADNAVPYTTAEPAVPGQSTVQRRVSAPLPVPDLSAIAPPASIAELADQTSTLSEEFEPSALFSEPSILDLAELVPEKDDIRSAVQSAIETVEDPLQPSAFTDANNQPQPQTPSEVSPDFSAAEVTAAPSVPEASVSEIVNQAIETLSPDLSQGENIANEVIQKLNALPILAPQKPLGPRTISKRFTNRFIAPQPLEAILSGLNPETSSLPDRTHTAWQADVDNSSQLAAALPDALSNGASLEKILGLAQSAIPGMGQAVDVAPATQQSFLAAADHPAADHGSEGDWESQFDLKSIAAPNVRSQQAPWAKQFKFDAQVEPKSDLQALPGKQGQNSRQNSGPQDSLDRVNQEDIENPTDIAAGEVIKSQNTDFANEPTDSGLGDEQTRESEGTKATNAGRFDTKPEEKIDDEKMELLARKFYQLLRLRLDDERNRHSNIFSGASPWADIITFPLIGDPKSEAPKTLQKDIEAPSLEMDRKVNDLTEALYQYILSQSLAERTSEGWLYPK